MVTQDQVRCHRNAEWLELGELWFLLPEPEEKYSSGIGRAGRPLTPPVSDVLPGEPCARAEPRVQQHRLGSACLPDLSLGLFLSETLRSRLPTSGWPGARPWLCFFVSKGETNSPDPTVWRVRPASSICPLTRSQPSGWPLRSSYDPRLSPPARLSCLPSAALPKPPLRLVLTSPFYSSVQRVPVATSLIAWCSDGLRAWPSPP